MDQSNSNNETADMVPDDVVQLGNFRGIQSVDNETHNTQSQRSDDLQLNISSTECNNDIHSSKFTIKAFGNVKRSGADFCNRSSAASSMASWIAASKNFILSYDCGSEYATNEKCSSHYRKDGISRRSVAKASIPRLSAPPEARQFLLSPGPLEDIKCRVSIVKKGCFFTKKYFTFILDDSNVTILVAKHTRRANGASTFLIYSSDTPGRALEKQQPVARLHANMMGTEYSLITDNDEKKIVEPSLEYPYHQHDLCAVAFAPNILGRKGPRKVTAILPKLVATGESAWHLMPVSTGSGSLIGRYRDAVIRSKDPSNMCIMLHNRPPQWNPNLSAYCLNFNGRVTRPSVKNFQLASKEDPNRIILQFGRVGSKEFALDYAFPMGPLQAFATALSAIDRKLGFE